MAKRGTKEATTDEKNALGTGDVNAPVTITQPYAAPAKPRAPAHLTKDAKKIWSFVTDQLHEMNMIGNVDQMLLSLLCQTYADWIDARTEIERLRRYYQREYDKFVEQAIENGEDVEDVVPRNIFVRDTIKDSKVDPLMKVSWELQTKIITLSKEFGMSPASRSAIRLITKAADSLNPFEAFLKDK